MYDNLLSLLQRPPLWHKADGAFWNDGHISAQMLRAHLDPESDGASRRATFIKKSAAWIKTLLPPAAYPSLLDIGCGPGIYAEYFAGQGRQVTGIDFSERSIRYAKEHAAGNTDITWYCQNYLNMELPRLFDCAVMIYCDYGALSAGDRENLLARVHRHLKPGGKFLLDVFSMETWNSFQEKKTWELHENGGFWNAGKHLAIQGFYRYPEAVTLEQTIVLTATGMQDYYIWNTCFTKEALTGEAEKAGFIPCGFWGDIAGAPCHEKDPALAVLLEKPATP